VKTILEQLAFYKKVHKTDRSYQFWQEGIHPELIQNEEMMRQKVDYIHNNPVNQLLPNVLAKQKALDKGAYDAIFVSDKDVVREATNSDVFFFQAVKPLHTR